MKNVSFLTFIIFACLAAQGYDRVTVDLDFVSELAQQKAEAAYGEDTPELPDILKKLGYDEYRRIQFRGSEGLWLGQNYRFVIEFLHPGYIFPDPVLVYEITDTHMQQIPFAREFFNYDGTNIAPYEIPETVGFAGVRIRYPINNPDIRDEVIVFQGASYFRALGKGNSYGLSARGLGVGIGEEGETFPRFTRLWLKKPTDPQADTMTIFALLEGKSVTGAYEFTLRPDEQTTIDVRCRIWPRGDPGKLCFAPLTSMFYFAENSEFSTKDWRPEVHDSDGLLIANGDQWIWRPLNNPQSTMFQNFAVSQLRGFGLLQRDRRFSSYEDLEAQYERRPTLWITPDGKWPDGEVVLVEMAVDHETADNINAFWKPTAPPSKDAFYELSYRMTWRTTEPNKAVANVIETRIGQKTLDASATTFVIEFTPPTGINADNLKELELVFESDGATVKTKPQLRYNKAENCVRAFFDLQRDSEQPRRLSLVLQQNGKPVTEQWTYLWKPLSN